MKETKVNVFLKLLSSSLLLLEQDNDAVKDMWDT
jgi:hypothetical protein